MTQSAGTQPGLPIVDIVFGVLAPERRRHRLIAMFVTVAVHACIVLAVARVERTPGSEPLARPLRIEIELARVDALVPAEPAAVREQPIAPHRPAPRARVQQVERRQAPAPAQAASLVAPQGPVDMTNDVFVLGNARTFAGGATDAQGTNTRAAQSRAAEPGSFPLGTGSAQLDPSRPVSLESQNWSCPWPSEAELKPIDEQTVVIRVIVDATGHAESATILADPGQGFGPAAASCAMHTHFTPARDREGKPVRARSPPIRITFTR